RCPSPSIYYHLSRHTSFSLTPPVPPPEPLPFPTRRSSDPPPHLRRLAPLPSHRLLRTGHGRDPDPAGYFSVPDHRRPGRPRTAAVGGPTRRAGGRLGPGTGQRRTGGHGRGPARTLGPGIPARPHPVQGRSHHRPPPRLPAARNPGPAPAQERPGRVRRPVRRGVEPAHRRPDRDLAGGALLDLAR